MGRQNKIFILFTLFLISSVFAQTDSNQKEQSNIQNYTPSKLLEKGKVDIKWFNNLYTQTRSESNGSKTDVPRSTFFTSSLEVFTGVSPNKKINAGLILEYRSNSFNGNSATSVFDFKNEVGTARSGLSNFAPSIKIAPFNKWNNFSIQSSIFIPIFKDEINANGYLGNKSYIAFLERNSNYLLN
jgi:hypothetical protein